MQVTAQKRRQIEGIILDEFTNYGLKHHLDFERLADRIVREVIENTDGWWTESFIKR